MAERSVLVRVKSDIDRFGRGMLTGAANVKKFANELDTADSRMSNLLQTSLALAPALVPMGATIVPVVTSLATQLGLAAAAAGVAVAAFNGTGEALDALNEYQLNPTTENLVKLNEAMAKLPESSREFVRFLDGEVMPALDRLQDVAADGVIPGATDYIEGLITRLPLVRNLIDEIATVSGDLLSEGGADIESGRWDDFMEFLTDEARPNLEAFATTATNAGEGVADALMGLDPITDMVTQGIVDISQAFADMNPSDYEGFVEYVQQVGPQVADTLLATGGALLAIVQAAAPVGSVALPVIEALANTLKVVAESPAGPVLIGTAAGLSAVSRAIALYNAANGSALVTALGGVDKEGKKASSTLRGLGQAAGGLIGLTLAYEGINAIARATDEALPGVETLTSRLMDLGDGRVATIGKEFYDLEESIRRITDRTQDESITDALQAPFELIGLNEAGTLRRARAEIESLDAAFANLATSGGVQEAKATFADFAKSQGLSAEQQKTLLNLMPQYREALAGAANNADRAAQGTERLTGAQKRAAAATQQLKDDLIALNETLEGRASMRAYEESLDQINKSVKENGRSLDITTGKGRRNAQTLDDIAAAALGVAENMRGTNKVQFLNRARADFIDAATKMTGSARAAERLADRLGLVERADPTVKFAEKGARDLSKKAGDILADLFNVDSQRPTPRIGVDDNATRPIQGIDALMDRLAADTASPTVSVVDRASATIRSVAAQLFNLNGDRAVTTVETIHRNTVINKVETQLSRSALGNLFPGVSAYASGGFSRQGDLPENHQPELVPAGAWRLFGEPETSGESFIPQPARS